ncbi:hypothetical protein EMIHUDRAFT_250420 [Emiliania huxleyi CCMP1516]|uniref:Uncharacterized protein n=2 Tax=Emiliania huxleyi TaxID=2903 RepID=A0A0D3I0L4_EMIH1|nr:hypothetical protein EMIHUDRAFT_250420 [Emiliania huxleyi CCMP1516]EOD04799.1 hypothetical protein EMIHUDRAFT_250420 [Emiliania huxleyi CCMP1516]|eukprot:XP_005757228.1 hypothetical protein EMIHUDRAFT_250420 [Emiliania huxleyi CCMP1516]
MGSDDPPRAGAPEAPDRDDNASVAGQAGTRTAGAHAPVNMHVAPGAKGALGAGHDHRHGPRGHDRQWYHDARGHFAPPPGDKAHDAPGEAAPKEERPERRADHTELAEMPAEFERTRAQVRALRDKAWARALEQRASDLFDEMESDTEHHELSGDRRAALRRGDPRATIPATRPATASKLDSRLVRPSKTKNPLQNFFLLWY